MAEQQAEPLAAALNNEADQSDLLASFQEAIDHPAPMTVEPQIGRLAAFRQLRQLLDQLEHQAVEEARAAGLSWAKIARGLGITAQSAHRKHDPEALRKDQQYNANYYRRLRAGEFADTD